MARATKPEDSRSPRRWSQRVTRESNALDLEPGVFTRATPRQVALSLRRSAERSRRRKGSPFQSAMSMLTFYINRAGKGLPRARLAVLNRAKDELRALYGKGTRGGVGPRRRRSRPPPR
jgi:hypothetical protein